MAVLARVIAIQGFITRITMVDVTAQSLGAALFDGRHRLPVTERHSLAEFLPIFGAVTVEDLSQLNHDGSSITEWAWVSPDRASISSKIASARWVKVWYDFIRNCCNWVMVAWFIILCFATVRPFCKVQT
jgi:hypothetical protein